MHFGSQKEKRYFVQDLQLLAELELGHIKGGEIVRGSFGTADQLEAAIFPQQHFGAAKLAVVVVAHGMAVGAGVMDHQDITDIDGGQAPLDGELIVILAQTAGHIIDMVQNGVLLAQDGDMVVSTVHGRTHQVGSAGIQTDVLLVDVLLLEVVKSTSSQAIVS